MLVVMNQQLNDRSADVGRDSDDIGTHVRVVGPGIQIVAPRDDQSEDYCAYDDRRADHAPGYHERQVGTIGCVRIRHGPLLKSC